jgi:hypothetical protein
VAQDAGPLQVRRKVAAGLVDCLGVVRMRQQLAPVGMGDDQEQPRGMEDPLQRPRCGVADRPGLDAVDRAGRETGPLGKLALAQAGMEPAARTSAAGSKASGGSNGVSASGMAPILRRRAPRRRGKCPLVVDGDVRVPRIPPARRSTLGDGAGERV